MIDEDRSLSDSTNFSTLTHPPASPDQAYEPPIDNFFLPLIVPESFDDNSVHRNTNGRAQYSSPPSNVLPRPGGSMHTTNGQKHANGSARNGSFALKATPNSDSALKGTPDLKVNPDSSLKVESASGQGAMLQGSHTTRGHDTATPGHQRDMGLSMQRKRSLSILIPDSSDSLGGHTKLMDFSESLIDGHCTVRDDANGGHHVAHIECDTVQTSGQELGKVIFFEEIEAGEDEMDEMSILDRHANFEDSALSQAVSLVSSIFDS